LFVFNLKTFDFGWFAFKMRGRAEEGRDTKYPNLMR